MHTQIFNQAQISDLKKNTNKCLNSTQLDPFCSILPKNFFWQDWGSLRFLDPPATLLPHHHVTLNLSSVVHPCSALPGKKIKRSGGGHCGGRAWLGRARCGNSIAVDVDAEILAGKDDGSIVSKRHVKALRVLHAALERRDEATVGRKQRRVEVVVVVGNQDAAHRVNADTDRIVSDTFATDLAQKCTVITEHLFQTSSAYISHYES